MSLSYKKGGSKSWKSGTFLKNYNLLAVKIGNEG